MVACCLISRLRQRGFSTCMKQSSSMACTTVCFADKPELCSYSGETPFQYLRTWLCPSKPRHSCHFQSVAPFHSLTTTTHLHSIHLHNPMTTIWTDTQRRPCEDRGLQMKEHQRLPIITGSQERGTEQVLGAARRNQPCGHLDFRPVASSTVREGPVLSHPVCHSGPLQHSYPPCD